MNYYNEIKEKLIKSEIYDRAKDYSKDRNKVNIYFEIGRLLSEAGKHYGQGIIKEYSKRLIIEVGKKYSETTLRYYRLFYKFAKCHSASDKLSYTHYKLLLPIKEDKKIDYYIDIAIKQNLSVSQLKERIKNKEYERLPEDTKNKLITIDDSSIKDLIKNPILIKNNSNYDNISDQILKKLLIDDIPSFLK